MPRTDLNDLLAFLAVARERSFTRAAAQLGVSPSALCHTLRGLEARLGLRLLARTTRSVAPTEAGERLLRAVGPAFDQIDAGLAALGELRDKPAGTIRITAGGLFFFNDTATTEIYTLSLHDALPISCPCPGPSPPVSTCPPVCGAQQGGTRSEEHTSELQSRHYLVCRLLLANKK